MGRIQWTAAVLATAVMCNAARAEEVTPPTDGSAAPAPLMSPVPADSPAELQAAPVQPAPADILPLAPDGSPHMGPLESFSQTPSGSTCGTCYTCEEPPWLEVRAAWLFLHRDEPADTALLFGGPSSPTSVPEFELFDASVLDFDWQSGWEVAATARLSNTSAVEFRYFQVDPFEAESRLTTPAGVDLFDFDGGFISLARSFDFRFRYESVLRSAELNLLQGPVGGRAQWLAGFRWLQVNEQLRYDSGDTGQPFDAFQRFQTKNNLYGLQLGANARLTDPCSPLEVRAFGRAGLFYADRQSSYRSDFPNPSFDSSLSDDDGELAFAAELGLSAIYRITRAIGLELSYHVLWIDEVALASEQAATTAYNVNQPRPPATTINGGTIFYHGLNAGLVFTW